MSQGITIRKPAFPSMLLITAETRYMKHIVTHSFKNRKSSRKLVGCERLFRIDKVVYVVKVY